MKSQAYSDTMDTIGVKNPVHILVFYESKCSDCGKTELKIHFMTEV